MRAQSIPAQITTVEDKIAGNLSLTQILILMVPVLFTTAVFAIFPPKMHLAIYKIPLVLVVLFISLILAMRVKGKVVLNWLIVILRYNLRPRYYVFNKNDVALRTLDLPVFEKRSRKLFNFKKSHAKQQKKAPIPAFSIQELLKLENILNNPNYNIILKASKKGGLNVFVGQGEK